MYRRVEHMTQAMQKLYIVFVPQEMESLRFVKKTL